MIRILRRSPDRHAALRLSAARLGFERSTRALRKAALDHVETQALVGLVLEATLARLVARDGGVP